MVNAWIEFVKKYVSERRGLSYACALSSPACKEAYQQEQTTNYKPQINRIGVLLRPPRNKVRPTAAKLQQARDLYNQTKNLVTLLPNSDKKSEYIVELNAKRERILHLLATA